MRIVPAVKTRTPPQYLNPHLRWRPLSQQRLTPDVKAWLADAGSLTHRLQGIGQFAVQPLRQGFAVPRAEESWLLDLPARQRALIREVALLVDGETLVYARSVIPLASLTGANRVLGHMARRSLGAELFRRPKARRRAIWAAQIDAGVLPVGSEGMAWGRQSLFRKRGKPLLVSEVFLPALWARLGKPVTLPAPR